MIDIFKKIGISGARYIEENIDEQYQAIKYFLSKNPPAPLGQIVANALISYQLSGTGEQYWWEFAHYGIDVINHTKYNKRYLPTKKRRLQKFLPYLEKIDLRYYKNMLDLLYFLEKIMGPGKTVNFAIKMYGYGARILTKQFIPYPMEVDIPWDSRIQRLSKYLGYERSDWRNISKQSHIPPLHLDSILWPAFTQKEKYRALGGPYKTLVDLIEGIS